MPTYEVYIKPGYHSKDVDANSEDEAKDIFLDEIRENLDREHVVAHNLDEED